jgi:Sec-independent protein translocase protein TatA
MFDFSLSELGVVGLVALIVLGPKEMIELIKSARKIKSSITEYFAESKKYLDEILEEEENIVDVIIDMDGNYQKTYKLNKIKPDIKDE